MNIREIVKANLAEIKKIVFSDAASEAQFVETLLADGETKVVIEPALQEGAIVSVVDSEGNKVPAPAGEHVTAEGIKITVDEAGAITSITEAEIEVEVEDEDMKKAKEEMENQFAEIANGINSKIAEAVSKFTEEIASYKSEFEKAKSDFEAEKTKNAEFVKQVFDLLNKIADSEAGTKEAASKQNFTGVKKPASPKDEVSNLVKNYLANIKN